MRGSSFVKIFMKVVASAACQILLACLLPAIGLAAEPVEKQAVGIRPTPNWCSRAGRSRKSRWSTAGQPTEIVRPAPECSCRRAGTESGEIRVRWEQTVLPGPSGTWLVTLDRARPCRLNVASPQTPVVRVKRAGRLLELSYDPHVGAPVYRNAPRDTPPAIRRLSGRAENRLGLV